MNNLEINNIGQDYILREVVKVAVLDKNNNIHYLKNGLIGGGLESNETYTESLHREALEEAGYAVEIVEGLGEVTAYRDVLSKKYVTKGFLAKLVLKTLPTTTQEDELNIQILVSTIADAVTYFEEQILLIEKEKENYTGDEYQSRLFNSMTAVHFLKQIK